MRKLLPLLLAAAALADAPKPPSTEEALVTSVESAKFVESTTPSSPKGSQGAMLLTRRGGPTDYNFVKH